MDGHGGSGSQRGGAGIIAVGGFGPSTGLAGSFTGDVEITGNLSKGGGSFKTPGMKVSWQVTGIRHDAWANAHRIPIEEDKSEKERGYFLHPELYGRPVEKNVEWARHLGLFDRIQP